LAQGTTRGDDGEELSCTTLVLVVPSHHIMDVGYLRLPEGLMFSDVKIDSDIKDVPKHDSPDAFGVVWASLVQGSV
jgi:hypothetical protein